MSQLIVMALGSLSGNGKGMVVSGGKEVVMKVSRRAFLLIAAYAASLIGAPRTVLAAGKKESNRVQFTEEMALEFAKTFVQGMGETSGLVPTGTTKIYDPDLGAIGYIVDIADTFGSPHGYIIYDVTDDSLISEYSFEPDVISPYASVSQDVPMLYRDDDSSVIALKTGPFSYVAAERDSGIVLSVPEPYGYDSDAVIPLSSTPDSGSWNDIFFADNLSVNPRFKIIEEAYSSGEFIAYREDIIKQKTKSYACGVSALLCCAEFYIPAESFFKYGTKYHYDTLWSLSNTKEIYSSGGVKFGSTNFSDLGPALVSYCSQYWQTIQFESSTTPVFLKFKNTVISKNFGIFGCGINQNGQRKEHIMPVEGYMRFQIAESMGSFMAALCVSDGWYGTVRYFNPNYARYTDTFGVFFSR